MATRQVPVLIVGAGPVGLMGALLLGRRGVATWLVERHRARLDAPKAHALNPRSLEICAAAGLPMDALHAAATPAAEGASVRMVTSLVGHQIGVLPYERQDDAVRALTRWPLINIAQPEVERVIEQALAGQPAVDLRRGLTWTGCRETADGVVSTLLDAASGATLEVQSTWLIAADGAGSAVRKHLGIGMAGPEALQTSMMIHFEADLRSLVADRPAILYFLFGPGASRVLIAYDLGRSWVLMHTCTADDQVADFGDAACRRLVLAAVGAAVPDLKIKGVRRWQMSAQVAERYRQGRLFLAGDAAHRFPPSGGLGLNTGLADIDNLAWKIAMVEAGHAGPGLLDSYEPERQRVARTNTAQSLANSKRMRVLAAALGIEPGQPVDPDAVAARLADPTERPAIDQAVAYQKEHFDSLRLQLGYVYGDEPDPDLGLPIDDFRPRAVPGARLPHVPLRDGRSSLDLVDPQAFTLLAGAGGAQAWRGWCADSDLPLTRRVEGTDFAGDGDLAAHLGLPAKGAVLVRPDGHLLSLAPDADPASMARLRETMLALLARDTPPTPTSDVARTA